MNGKFFHYSLIYRNSMIKKMTKQVENVLKMMMMAHTYEHISRYCEITSKFFFRNVAIFPLHKKDSCLGGKKWIENCIFIRRNFLFFYSLFNFKKEF